MTKILFEIEGRDDLSEFEGKPYRFLALDTEEPFLQWGNRIFKGSYEDIVGTDLIYEISEVIEDEQGKDSLPAPVKDSSAIEGQEDEEKREKRKRLIFQKDHPETSSRRLLFKEVTLKRKGDNDVVMNDELAAAH